MYTIHIDLERVVVVLSESARQEEEKMVLLWFQRCGNVMIITFIFESRCLWKQEPLPGILALVHVFVPFSVWISEEGSSTAFTYSIYLALSCTEDSF